MTKKFKYPAAASFEQKVYSIIQLLGRPTVTELVFEISELEGITGEEPVAACSIEVEEAIANLIRQELVVSIEKDGERRFTCLKN